MPRGPLPPSQLASTLVLFLLGGCAGGSLRLDDFEHAHRSAESEGAVRLASESPYPGGQVYTALAAGPVLPPPIEGQEGEFCKLNPGACLPGLPPPEPGEPEATADPWKSFACIQACKAGSEAMEKFCENLPGKTKRQKALKALCWGASSGSKAACVVFCRAYFGPPRDPSP
jgi:hypothetical protein